MRIFADARATRPVTSRSSIESPDGPLLLAGQAVYSHGEWVGIAGRARGREHRPADREAYDRSIARLQGAEPEGGPLRARPPGLAVGVETGYTPRAVLGGELAVPCTCNPLQQG